MPKLLPCKYVVVGRDIRKSSDEIFEYLNTFPGDTPEQLSLFG